MYAPNQYLKNVIYLLGILLNTSHGSIAQIAGNAIYTNPNSHKITKSNGTNIQNNKTFLISSAVVYHAKADRYVAVFGVVQEGKTIKNCSDSITQRIRNFSNSVQRLGIPKSAIILDAITQNRVYEYELDETKNIAQERLKGFEIKKNIILSFTNRTLLDQIMVLASQEGIYDLIKVDYIIDDTEKIYAQLYDEALKIIEQKKERYLKLTDHKYLGQPQIVLFEKDQIAPVQAYKTYTAHESNTITLPNHRNSNFKKISAHRISTHYFEAAPSINFDKIIQEHHLIPCVQFSIRLQLRFQAV
ncbi:SIMPL domain-containing protein [Aureispira anguillae]|uniref:SIMPL domain-containing protein n=1 Tax=Aureispira anguillae TaxID=2864201 RepID=A0A916DVT7_9BACT|nr:SIMPL domain-containing protein [Aureispira anguillae]BDS13930.1 SIMPL domain-containing protein [Aureispira anguillae]